MPTLPITSPAPLDGGELVVRSDADVLAVLPTEVQRASSAPIRDALVAGLRALMQYYQRRARRGAAQSDVLRATSYYLEGLGEDRGVYLQPGESQEAFRARVLGIPALVSPTAIVEAVNAILAEFTTATCRYFEQITDAFYTGDGTTDWASFVFVDDAVTGGSPHYSDRLYPDDVAENGVQIASREVIGAWAFAEEIGRYFVLRLPPIEHIDDDGTYAFDETATDEGAFASDGSDTSGAESDGSVIAFIFTDQVQSDEVYAAIVSTVDAIRGQGMRWMAYVDPLLAA